jgi:glycosyltransferase involved in cell wall biosynthesis
MRILIATGIFKPEVGGPATMAFELGKRFQATGHDITIITYSNQARFSFDKDFNFKLIRVTRAKQKLINYLRYFFVAYREIKNHDVVYALDWFSAGLPLMLAAKIAGKKYVVRVGGGYIWEKYLTDGRPAVTLQEFYDHGLYKSYRMLFYFIRRVLRGAACVVFNSDIQRELYIKIYSLNPEKTQTIFNATPENRLSNLVYSYNDKHLERDKEIVFAGRFSKAKNVESLIRAFAKLTDLNFKLILIGDGPLKQNLEAVTKSLALENRVEFVLPLKQSDLYYRIAHCYLLVIPSWTDIAPQQVYECLALGIPFLITKENYLNIRNQIPRMIDPHNIDDIAKHLNELLDPNAYESYTDSLKQVNYEHSWDAVVGEHLKMFIHAYR